MYKRQDYTLKIGSFYLIIILIYYYTLFFLSWFAMVYIKKSVPFLDVSMFSLFYPWSITLPVLVVRIILVFRLISVLVIPVQLSTPVYCNLSNTHSSLALGSTSQISSLHHHLVYFTNISMVYQLLMTSLILYYTFHFLVYLN